MNEAQTDSHHKIRELLRLTLMGAGALFSWLGLWSVFVAIDLVALGSTLIGGYPIYKETLQSLTHKKINMEVSMSLHKTRSSNKPFQVTIASDFV